jgi:hypothetical protein
LIILFLCTSPVVIENITAQVQDVDVDIYTAHWAQFTFWQPRKGAFYKAATHYNYFFSTKKSDELQIFYQITELLSKKSVSGIVIFFSMKFCKKIHNLGNESVINQYAT